MESVSEEFAGKLVGADVGLFFYAGHSIQFNKKNLLVPTDAELANQSALVSETVSLNSILRHMEREAKSILVFLDACQLNPLATVLTTSQTTKLSTLRSGLTDDQDLVPNTYMSFACMPDTLASEGQETNSPYTVRTDKSSIEAVVPFITAQTAEPGRSLVRRGALQWITRHRVSLLSPLGLCTVFLFPFFYCEFQMIGKLSAGIAALALTACGSPQRVLLTAGPGQQSIVRQGVPALISQKKNIVMLRPNTRLVQVSGRPAFTIAVHNHGRAPITLHETSIRAEQSNKGKSLAVRVFRYDDLVKEEQTRQALATFGAALSGAANVMAASNAGYVNTTGSVTTYGPGGTKYGTYSATTYDPIRAQIAQQNANADTAANFERIRADGDANLGRLEATILKDNTVMPGEWSGGTIVLAPPESSDDGTSNYSIIVAFGGEDHIFAVSHVKQ